MLLGDFNARTSKCADYMSDEGNNFTDDTTTSSFVPVERQRFDSTINRGKRLIEIFKNCKLRIIIG